MFEIYKILLKAISGYAIGIAPLVTGALIGGAASLLGGIGSAVSSANASKAATDAQIKWERERAQNAHQWEVEDLKKAGLNPVLSAGGTGAQTGSISPHLPDMSGINSAGAGIAQAVQNAIINEQTQQSITADSKLKSAQEQKIYSEIGLDKQREILLKAQAISELSKSGKLDAEKTSALKGQLLMEEQANESRIRQRQIQSEIDNARIQAERIKKEIDLLEEKIRTATTGVEKAQYEKEILKKKNELYGYAQTIAIGAKIVATATPIIGGIGIALKGKKYWQMGKEAYKILKSIPK